MLLKKLKLYYNTLKYMKPTQVSYQLYYRLRKKFGKSVFSKKLEINPVPLNFMIGICSSNSYNLELNSFTFLNKKQSFKENIDWNFSKHGKLWTYNLNYFDFLNQEGMNKELGMSLIKQYIHSSKTLKDGLEPYPISLRGINWIKFLSKNTCQDFEIDQCLYNQYYTLLNNREFHLMGNHLLENGFSLFFGAYYFKDPILLMGSVKILKSELKEQILSDGGHFELSPMYHQIILNRLLDCINLAKYNNWMEFKDIELVSEHATAMLGWLEAITYQNGDIPMLNDSTFGIAPSSKQLFDYAKRLDLNWGISTLSASGYRKWENKKYELFMDIGEIGPDYIPGHAHADTFNFELYIERNPFIVDKGISTYEKNDVRQTERSTFSHNTVEFSKENSSNVWGGFRVAKRARILNLKENDQFIVAEHNGYKHRKIIHQRSFFRDENQLTITDCLIGDSKNESSAYLHFHPSITLAKIESNKLFFTNKNVSIEFSEGIKSIDKFEYDYCYGFNQTTKSIALKIQFNKQLKTIISL